MPHKIHYRYKMAPISCPEGKIAIVHDTDFRYVPQIYKEGLLPRCKLPIKKGRRKYIGMKDSYTDEPKTMRHCAVFAYLADSPSSYMKYPVCACVDKKKTFVGSYKLADKIFGISEDIAILERIIEQIKVSKRLSKEEKRKEIAGSRIQIRAEKKRMEKYANLYNDNTIPIEEYLRNREKYGEDVEILIPEGVPASQIKRCAKRKKLNEF